MLTTGGAAVIGIGSSSNGWMTGVGSGGAMDEVLFENRLAQDLPGAGWGWGATTGGGNSPRLRGVGGGGKSEAVGAGGGG